MEENNQIEIFQSNDGHVCLEVSLHGQTIWLTQGQMAALFDTSTDNVGLPLKNIYQSTELAQDSTTEDISVVRSEGRRQVTRTVKHYNLDAVISVGYRVSSRRATHFKVWATNLLKQHLVHGYTLNEQRLQAKPVESLVNDNTLVALALLVAESLPAQKELMIRLIEHFILLKGNGE